MMLYNLLFIVSQVFSPGSKVNLFSSLPSRTCAVYRLAAFGKYGTAFESHFRLIIAGFIQIFFFKSLRGAIFHNNERMEAGNLSVSFLVGVVRLIQGKKKKIQLNYIRTFSAVTCLMNKRSKLAAAEQKEEQWRHCSVSVFQT